MDTVFPFGLPGPTAFYLTLYLLTLVVHVIFMNYVLAGAGYLAVHSLIDGGRHSTNTRVSTASILRDWLPFALGATITAGVAPLLFIQVIYKESFYTANLLLFNRWMAVVPVLIVGFYLLYLFKSRTMTRRSRSARVIVVCGAFACFAYVGLSWTRNHLLSQDEAAWAAVYESGGGGYRTAATWSRFLVWGFGSIPAMITIVAWQLRRADRDDETQSVEIRSAAILAVAGLGLSILCATGYYLSLPTQSRGLLGGRFAGPYLLLAIAGTMLQLVAWFAQYRESRWNRSCLILASVGVLLTIGGIAVVREAGRLGTSDLASLAEQHRSVAGAGGFTIFLAFLIINAAIITWCIRMVIGDLPSSPQDDSAIKPKGASKPHRLSRKSGSGPITS